MVKIYSTTYINSFFAICRGLSSSILPSFFLHGTEFRRCFLFRGMVWNGIPRVCFYFCFEEQNSELFSLPWKGSERNSERFLFRGIARIPSEISICSIYSIFRGIIFLSEIPNPTHEVKNHAVPRERKILARLTQFDINPPSTNGTFLSSKNIKFSNILKYSKHGPISLIFF
jgi:hypothetical protein